MAKILVTGGAGFIGSVLVEKLAENKDNYVYAIDKKRIVNIEPKSNIKLLHYHDLKDYILVPEVDIVYHLAAYNGTKHFYNEPYEVIQDNILSTINLINAYKKYNPLFIYTGTPEGRPFSTEGRTKEDAPIVIDSLYNTRWSYANSKALAEQAVIHSGFDFINVIPYNIYGPKQVDHFIPEFIERVKNNKFEIHGAFNTRTFLYIDDCIDALIKIVDAPKNTTYNIGGEEEIPIAEIAILILQLMGKKEELKVFDAPKGSTLRRCPDISKIKNTIDWKPNTSLEEGLKKVINYLC